MKSGGILRELDDSLCLLKSLVLGKLCLLRSQKSSRRKLHCIYKYLKCLKELSESHPWKKKIATLKLVKEQGDVAEMAQRLRAKQLRAIESEDA